MLILQIKKVKLVKTLQLLAWLRVVLAKQGYKVLLRYTNSQWNLTIKYPYNVVKNL